MNGSGQENLNITSQKEPDPLLIKAWKVLNIYAKATGTVVCVLDQEFLPIQEMFSDMVSEKNICLYCLKCTGKDIAINRPSDLRASPCNLMHMNAIKEAHRFGGSYL
jgi:hypothetical protein